MHRFPKLKRVCAVLLALIIAIPLTAMAQSETKLRTGTVTANDVRLREEPSLSSKILTKADSNAAVLIAGETIKNSDGEWFNVTYDGQTGYMSAQYIELPQEDEGTSVAGRVTGNSVRFRESPNTSGKILAELNKGAGVDVLGITDGWYKAVYNEATGYISSDYVEIIVETEDGEVATISGADTASGDVQALRAQLVEYAKTFLGCKYVYGTANGKTFDCSGLTSYVYKHFGYSLNRSAAGQLNNGTKVEKSNLVQGDLVLFRDTSISKAAASHVGMYIGSGQFIHASSGSSRVVKISSLNESYYTRVYIAARRIVQ